MNYLKIRILVTAIFLLSLSAESAQADSGINGKWSGQGNYWSGLGSYSPTILNTPTNIHCGDANFEIKLNSGSVTITNDQLEFSAPNIPFAHEEEPFTIAFAIVGTDVFDTLSTYEKVGTFDGKVLDVTYQTEQAWPSQNFYRATEHINVTLEGGIIKIERDEYIVNENKSIPPGFDVDYFILNRQSLQ